MYRIVRPLIVLIILLVTAMSVQASQSVTNVIASKVSDYNYRLMHWVPIDSTPADARWEVKRVYGSFRLDESTIFIILPGTYDGHSGSSHPRLSETWYFSVDGSYSYAWYNYANWKVPGPLVPLCGETKIELRGWWTPSGGSEQYIGLHTLYLPPCI